MNLNNFSIKTSKVSSDIRYSDINRNFPELFSGEIKIGFNIQKKSIVKLTIYDVFGRKLQSLLDKELSCGCYEFKWNADKFGPGVYYCKILADGFIESKKIILLKNIN
jgi:hypothetical protein